LLCLPPHITHFFQLLDRSFYKPLNSDFNLPPGTWIRSHPGRGITKRTFGNIFAEALGRAATLSAGIHGFRAFGMYPLNKHAVPEAAVSLSSVSSREACPTTSISATSDSGNDLAVSTKTTSIPIESSEIMRVSTPRRKHTGREASPSTTPSPSSSAVTFEEI
jgi:hypothetical protein